MNDQENKQDNNHDGIDRRTVLTAAGRKPRRGPRFRYRLSTRTKHDHRFRHHGRHLEPGILGAKGQHQAQPLAQARRRAESGEQRPILFLVHGSSNSTRSSYDLIMPPGKGEYSLMNVMAREGYDVWTMDHDGYGYSGSSGNNSDIMSGVEDLKAAMPVIRRKPASARCTCTARRRAASARRRSRRRSPSMSTG